MKNRASDHYGKSVSIYDSSVSDPEVIVSSEKKAEVKNKGENHRHHDKQFKLERKSQLVKDPNGKTQKDIQEFERLLSTAVYITLSTKLKTPMEQPLVGKAGHTIVTGTGETLAVLVSGEPAPGCMDRFCCSYKPNENDPIYYYLSSPRGEELMSICGLDEEASTESAVSVTYSPLRSKLGTILYNFVGASQVEENLSKATIMAGREKSFMIPTSVLDSNGGLLYIFRRDVDDLRYTEILSADGNAITVAEIFLDSKNNPKGSLVSTVSAHQGHERSFRINFLEELTPKEKSLILGTVVTVFNRWMTKEQKNQSCCIIL